MQPQVFRDKQPQWKPFSSIRRSKKNRHLVDFDPAFPFRAECYTLFIDHHLTPHTHDYLEIAYVVAGEGFCEIRNRRAAMKTGDLVLVGDSDFHTFWSDYRKPLHIIVLYFLPELVSKGGYDYFNYDYIAVFRSPEHPARIPARQIGTDLPRLIERLYWMTQTDRFSPLAAKTELYRILLSISSRTAASRGADAAARDGATRSPRTRTPRDTRRVEAVIAHLHENIEKEIRLPRCAQIAGLSPYAFCRFFRRATGDTLVEYVNKMRIDRARELLATSTLPVSHIALDVGYQTISYFNRVFRSLVGMTPTQFRQHVGILANAVEEPSSSFPSE